MPIRADKPLKKSWAEELIDRLIARSPEIENRNADWITPLITLIQHLHRKVEELADFCQTIHDIAKENWVLIRELMK